MINTYIPYLTNKEKKYLNDCLRSNFVSTAGPKVSEFENLFSKKFKFKQSVAVNSGTSSIHLALLTLGIGSNDLVIVPTFTFAATANAISYTNAKPWFFDCDKDLTLDINKLELSLKKNTKLVSRKLIEKSSGRVIKAIIPVLTMGKKINFSKFEKLADKYFLKIIYDSAACHDPKIMNFKKNNKSIFCFSFNGNKTITTGAGGIMATNSILLADRARLFSTVGKKKTNYDYEVIGYNYKMTNIQASLGISQLANLNNILNKKKNIFDFYKSNLNNLKKYEIVCDKEHINWVFAIVLKNSKDFKIIKEKLNEFKIQIDYFWKPLHLQKPYKQFMCDNLHQSEKLWKRIVILPSHPSITKKNQEKVCNIINKIL